MVPTIPRAAWSMWLMVLALGRTLLGLLAMEFFRTRLAPEAAPVATPAAPVLSLRPLRGREDGVDVMCSFC